MGSASSRVLGHEVLLHDTEIGIWCAVSAAMKVLLRFVRQQIHTNVFHIVIPFCDHLFSYGLHIHHLCSQSITFYFQITLRC